MIYDGPSDLSDLKTTVWNAAQDLRPHLQHFDLIAVHGLSGILVGAPLSLELQKPLLVVRTEADYKARKRHDQYIGWGPPAGWNTPGDTVLARALWVDDFVSSGDTQRRVAKKLLERGAWMEMAYLYRDRELSPPPASLRRYERSPLADIFKREEEAIPF